MAVEGYLSFLVAVVIFVAIPGPTVLFTIAKSVSHGARGGMLVVLGTGFALALQLLAVGFGMATLMTLMADWFEVIRWIGVAYLFYLGIKAWRNRVEGTSFDVPQAPPLTRRSSGAIVFQGFLVSSTNPKSLVFLAAFLPQFIDPAGAVGMQMAILAATLWTVAMVSDSGYALLAGRAGLMLRKPSSRLIADRLSGTLLIGTGLWLSLQKRL